MVQGEIRGLVDRLLSITSPRIAVLGDVILDRYIWGQVDRISPEAPIQVFRVSREEYRLGGAGNVANNLKALGARVFLAGLCGKDTAGEALLDLVRQRDLSTEGILQDPDRPTILKSRHLAQSQQILRVDREHSAPVSRDQGRDLLRKVMDFGPDCLILSDYGKGVCTADTIRTVIDRAEEMAVPVLVDPKTTDYSRYAGATSITPNRLEFEKASGCSVDDPDSLRAGARKLIRSARLDGLIITLASEGICLIHADGRMERVPARARAVYDVTGAGDTVIAILGYALGGGLSLSDGVHLANAGASVVVGRVGAATVTAQEIREALLLPDRPEGGKIRTREEIASLVETLKAGGKKVVLTNGCFDVLHAGHVEYLAYARSLGSMLVVGVNSDESVRRMNKGEGRPIVPLEDRMRILAALESVDLVVPFEEDTPQALVEAVLPHTLVKGEDWRDKGVIGRDVVETSGGRVVLAPMRPGVSSSAIIEKIRKGG